MTTPIVMPAGRRYDPTFIPYIVGERYGGGAGSPGTLVQVYFYPNTDGNYYDGQGNPATIAQAQFVGLKGDGVE